MSVDKKQFAGRRGRWVQGSALLLALTVAGCDSLLEVDLPDAVTDAAFEDPATAPILVNSVMAGVECGYSGFSLNAAGYEDNFQRNSGVAGTYSEYPVTPGGGNCDSGAAYSSAYYDALLIARAQGYDTYDKLTAWTDAQVPNRKRLLGQTALYTAITLDMFGEFWCETAVDEGPLMTPNQTLTLAEEWVNKAIGHIDETGDYALTTTQGTIASSIKTMALGLRARIKWAKGDLAGAAADAALVPNGFVAYALREEGEDRRNTVFQFEGTGAGQQAAGFLQGPVRLRIGTSIPYGVSVLGKNPVTGQTWPNTIPFTGYLNLAIESSTGLTVDANGYPFTTADAGTVADSRVQHTKGNTGGGAGQDQVILKYKSYADDIPLINWREMRLIQAEYQNETANSQSAAIALINQLRTAANLPLITGSYSQARVNQLIIEERRRALWLEGRYWSTKIQNPELLWFPRQEGAWLNSQATGGYPLGGGVRLLMQQDEYQINPNLSLESRGTGCSAATKPIFN